MTKKGLPDRWLAIAGVISFLVGLASAASMMYAAWQHNSQGEFHELAADGTTIIHWLDWSLVGVAWFGTGLAGSFCLLGILTAIAYGILRMAERKVMGDTLRRKHRIAGSGNEVVTSAAPTAVNEGVSRDAED